MPPASVTSALVDVDYEYLLHIMTGCIARLGNPKHITSKRGTTFTFQLWTSVATLLGITLHQTTAYRPAANGVVERFHRILKAALMSRYKDSYWFIQLLWVLLGLKTTPKDTLYVSPAKMVHGNPLVIPAKFFSVYNLLR
ncbi:uncharacterized protein [Palaemon carinicauda]|uniref:uncharacterized protein n=1 Tax=Palaemon carinicauda TaxID=392227 RepID=UPI0035B6044C